METLQIVCAELSIKQLWHAKVKTRSRQRHDIQAKDTAGRIICVRPRPHYGQATPSFRLRQTQKEAAFTKLRDATANIDRGTYQEPSQITIAAYAQEYFFDLRSQSSAQYLQDLSKDFETGILPALGKVKLTDLTHRQVQFVTCPCRSKRSCRPKPSGNIHGIPHNMLESAIRDELLFS